MTDSAEIINSLKLIKVKNSPTVQYEQWSEDDSTSYSIRKTTLKLNEFNFNEIKILHYPDDNSQRTLRKQIKSCNVPCLLGLKDITNLNKLSSIKHESVLNIANILQYNSEAYSTSYNSYRDMLDSVNAEYLCNKAVSTHDELIELLRTKEETKEANAIETDTLLSKYKDMGINIANERNNIAPLLENIRDHVANSADIQEEIDNNKIPSYASIDKWQIDLYNLLRIMQTDYYMELYRALYAKAINHVSHDAIISSGIIHCIIFRGNEVYNYIMDYPDFIIYIIENEVNPNIPLYIKKRTK